MRGYGNVEPGLITSVKCSLFPQMLIFILLYCSPNNKHEVTICLPGNNQEVHISDRDNILYGASNVYKIKLCKNLFDTFATVNLVILKASL